MSTLEPSVINPGNFLIRLFFMAVYFLILSVIRFVLWAVVLVQLLYHLFGSDVSPGAQRVGQAISDYMYRVWLFLTCNTNNRPFPFANRKQ